MVSKDLAALGIPVTAGLPAASAFSVRAADAASSVVGTVTIQITAVNDPPAARDDTLAVTSGGVANVTWLGENDEIIAPMIDAEATLKTYRRGDGHVWLLPHNPAYEPIPGDDATILGKVVALLRKV